MCTSTARSSPALGGQNHTFKAGYALNRIGDDVHSNYTNGRFNIYWGEAFIARLDLRARGGRTATTSGRTASG